MIYLRVSITGKEGDDGRGAGGEEGLPAYINYQVGRGEERKEGRKEEGKVEDCLLTLFKR